ncbi:MAG: glutamate-1-semialdehyde 2,1-aminomutase [Candidatus Omnitrophota bacterium]
MNIRNSMRLYKQAIRIMPGGVNSPVRSGYAVGTHPLFISRGRGAYVYDVDGNRFIDYMLSWGPLILGHAYPHVVRAVKKAAGSGMSFGASTENEVVLAQMITKTIPSIEMLRLVNSGTEAVMSAVRLARGYTGRDKIIKFAGGYHGHSDSMLVEAGSGSLTFGRPSSKGIPLDFSKNTLVLPYNDIDKFYAVLKKYPRQIAAVVIEPIAANMGVVLPRENFLADIRGLTKKYNVILIFDEVITGFRLCFGSVQKIFKVEADITCLGKIIGGGMPIGAFGGKREIMQNIAPLGGVYQAGTLSGNPLAVSSGIETLSVLSGLDYQKIDVTTEGLCGRLEENLKRHKIKYCLNLAGSMFTLFFTDKKVVDLNSAKSALVKRFALYYNLMLRYGIMFPPSQFEACFLSFAHTRKDIEQTAKVQGEVVKQL